MRPPGLDAALPGLPISAGNLDQGVRSLPFSVKPIEERTSLEPVGESGQASRSR